MKIPLVRAAALVALALLAQGADARKGLKAESDASQRAVSLLLAIADEPIPTGSSCQGRFGNDGPPRVRDLVAMELATFSRGKNTLVGRCTGAAGQAQACHVAITHEFGEEASSADIRFQAQDGRAVASSLTCVLTP